MMDRSFAGEVEGPVWLRVTVASISIGLTVLAFAFGGTESVSAQVVHFADAGVGADAGVPNTVETVVVGAPFNDAVATNAGRAYLYRDNGGLHEVATLSGAGAEDRFGSSVAAGDLNGDGLIDVVVGAPRFDLGGIEFGRAYVYLAPVSTMSVPAVLSSPNSNSRFGTRVVAAGDLNGDGFGDVAVGAPDDNSAATGAGRVYIYYGGAGGAFNTTPDATINGAQAYEHFGAALAGGADLDGDGFDDLAVGAPDADTQLIGPITEAGRVYIYRGAPSFPALTGWSLIGTVSTNHYGTAIAMARDLNGDGFGDVIVGAPFADTPGTDTGRAYVYFGGAPFTRNVAGVLTGLAANDLFAFSLAAADLNGDGCDDVAVGADGNDAAGVDAGAVYVFYGGPGATFNNAVDQTLFGTAGAQFGHSLAGAGTGALSNAIVVGAFRQGGVAKGRASMFSGGFPPLVSAVDGENNGDYFGWAVGGN